MRVEKLIRGLDVSGNLISGNWEGDPSIPNGVHFFNDYIEDLEILSPDGSDLTDYVTEEFLTYCEQELLHDC